MEVIAEVKLITDQSEREVLFDLLRHVNHLRNTISVFRWIKRASTSSVFKICCIMISAPNTRC